MFFVLCVSSVTRSFAGAPTQGSPPSPAGQYSNTSFRLPHLEHRSLICGSFLCVLRASVVNPLRSAGTRRGASMPLAGIPLGERCDFRKDPGGWRERKRDFPPGLFHAKNEGLAFPQVWNAYEACRCPPYEASRRGALDPPRPGCYTDRYHQGGFRGYPCLGRRRRIVDASYAWHLYRPFSAVCQRQNDEKSRNFAQSRRAAGSEYIVRSPSPRLRASARARFPLLGSPGSVIFYLDYRGSLIFLAR